MTFIGFKDKAFYYDITLNHLSTQNVKLMTKQSTVQSPKKIDSEAIGPSLDLGGC